LRSLSGCGSPNFLPLGVQLELAICELKNNSVLLYSSKAKKLAAADALSEELIGIIGSAKEDIGHLTAVQYAAEHFEDSFKAKLDVIGQL